MRHNTRLAMVYDMKPYDTLRDDTAKQMKIEVKEKKKKNKLKNYS